MISQPTLILLKTFLEQQMVEQKEVPLKNTPLYEAYIEITKYLEEKQQKERAKASIPFVLRKERLKSNSKVHF